MIFTGNIEAIYDAWLIGDSSLKKMYDTLVKMRDQARVNHKPLPYLFEYYNVHGFWKTSSSLAKYVIGQVYNAFVEALDTGRRLPRFLLVILDKDIIEDVDVFDYGAPKEIYNNVKWLSKQIEIQIQRRITETTAVKPGALYCSDPKIVFVTMIRRPMQFPARSQMEKVVSL